MEPCNNFKQKNVISAVMVEMLSRFLIPNIQLRPLKKEKQYLSYRSPSSNESKIFIVFLVPKFTNIFMEQ